MLIVDLALSFDDSDNVSFLQLDSLWDSTVNDVEVNDSGGISENSSNSLVVVFRDLVDLGLNSDEIVWVGNQGVDCLQTRVIVLVDVSFLSSSLALRSSFTVFSSWLISGSVFSGIVVSWSIVISSIVISWSIVISSWSIVVSSIIVSWSVIVSGIVISWSVVISSVIISWSVIVSSIIISWSIVAVSVVVVSISRFSTFSSVSSVVISRSVIVIIISGSIIVIIVSGSVIVVIVSRSVIVSVISVITLDISGSSSLASGVVVIAGVVVVSLSVSVSVLITFLREQFVLILADIIGSIDIGDLSIRLGDVGLVVDIDQSHLGVINLAVYSLQDNNLSFLNGILVLSSEIEVNNSSLISSLSLEVLTLFGLPWGNFNSDNLNN